MSALEFAQNETPRTTNALKDKRIAVLGGSSGIGLATAQAAARERAQVVVVSSRQERVDEALASLPETAEGDVTDLTDAAAIESLFERLGTIDHLVFTAGESQQLGPLAETDVEAARRFFTLRYWGAFLAAKSAVARIRNGGSIVFTSGIASQRPLVRLVARSQHLCGDGRPDARARGRACAGARQHRLSRRGQDAAMAADVG